MALFLPLHMIVLLVLFTATTTALSPPYLPDPAEGDQVPCNELTAGSILRSYEKAGCGLVTCRCNSHGVQTCAANNCSAPVRCPLGRPGLPDNCGCVVMCKSEVREDPCATHTCQNNGSCAVNPEGLQSCHCLTGYTGKRCEEDVDECSKSLHNCGREVHAKCENTPGSYLCHCKKGYSTEAIAVDVNLPVCKAIRCEMLPRPENGTVRHYGRRINGTVKFSCDDGFVIKGKDELQCMLGESNVKGTWSDRAPTCEPDLLGDCRGFCWNGGTCSTNATGAAECHCPAEFDGLRCEVRKNSSACTSGPCANGGTCVDGKDGGFRCVCVEGRTGDFCSEDLDECESSLHDCHPFANCTNVANGYVCQCRDGFRDVSSRGSGTHCKDVNECLGDQRLSSCEMEPFGKCENTPGSFNCHCSPGFVRINVENRPRCFAPAQVEAKQWSSQIRVFKGTNVKLYCQVSGFPRPQNTRWCRLAPTGEQSCQVDGDGGGWEVLYRRKRTRERIRYGVSELTIGEVALADNGTVFTCSTENVAGSDNRSVTLLVTNTRRYEIVLPLKRTARWSENSTHITRKQIQQGFRLIFSNSSVYRSRLIESGRERRTFHAELHIPADDARTIGMATSFTIIIYRSLKEVVNIQSEDVFKINDAQVKSLDACPAATTENLKGKINWPETPVTQISEEKCPVADMIHRVVTDSEDDITNAIQNRPPPPKKVDVEKVARNVEKVKCNLPAKVKSDLLAVVVPDHSILDESKGGLDEPDFSINEGNVPALINKASKSAENINVNDDNFKTVVNKAVTTGVNVAKTIFTNLAPNLARRRCIVVNGVPRWEAPDTKNCPYASFITQSLQHLAEDLKPGRRLSKRAALNQTERLQHLTKDTQNLTYVDVDFTSQALLNVIKGTMINNTEAENVTVEKQFRGNFFGTVDNLLQSRPGTVRNATRESRWRVVTSMELLAESVPLNKTGTSRMNETPRLGLAVLCPRPGASVNFQDRVDGGRKQSIRLFQGDGNKINAVGAGFSIPASVLEMAHKQQLTSTDGCPTSKAKFVLYRNSELFIDERLNDSNVSVLGSDVITSQVGNGVVIRNATVPVEMSFLVNEDTDGLLPSCSFWDENLTSAGENASGWSQTGCWSVGEPVNTTYGVRVRCQCNHLTSFAVLLVRGGGDGDSGSLSNAEKEGLSIITYVGCALSIFGLLVTLLIVVRNRGFKTNRHKKLLAGLCVSLLTALVLFIISIDAAPDWSEDACQSVGLLLHYFLLQAFVWMAAEAVLVYLMLVKVQSYVQRRFSSYSLLAALCLPGLVICISTVSAGMDVYSKDKHCWIENTTVFLAAFCAPIAVVVLLNTTILISQICVMSKSAKARSPIQMLKVATALSFLLGITWMLGLLLLATDNSVLQYMFVIFNSLQGFFVFAFFTVMSSGARKKIMSKFTRNKPSIDGSTSLKTRPGHHDDVESDGPSTHFTSVARRSIGMQVYSTGLLSRDSTTNFVAIPHEEARSASCTPSHGTTPVPQDVSTRPHSQTPMPISTADDDEVDGQKAAVASPLSLDLPPILVKSPESGNVALQEESFLASPLTPIDPVDDLSATKTRKHLLQFFPPDEALPADKELPSDERLSADKLNEPEKSNRIVSTCL